MTQPAFKPLHYTDTPPLRKTRKFRLIVVLVFLLLVLLAVADAFWIEPALMLTVTRYEFVSEQIPQTWSGRSIAFFTDAHLGPTYPPERLKRVASVIRREQPDLILFGGDLIDNRTPHDAAYDAAIISVLSEMQSPFGQFAVVGNHDNRLNAEYQRVDRLFSSSGFTLLDNTSIYLDGLWLGGLAESYFGEPDLDLTFSSDGLLGQADPPEAEGSEQDPLRVLLMHQPDFAAKLHADSANLIFSGHSHNGQVTFFGHPIFTVYEGAQYPYGHYSLADGRQLIVSRGLGTVGIPARFFAPPEVVFVTLRRE